jgi:hypothetical protein
LASLYQFKTPLSIRKKAGFLIILAIYIICSKYLGQVTLKNIFGILPKDHWLKDIDFVNMGIMFNPAINISSIFVMIMFKINKRNFNDYE